MSDKQVEKISWGFDDSGMYLIQGMRKISFWNEDDGLLRGTFERLRPMAGPELVVNNDKPKDDSEAA